MASITDAIGARTVWAGADSIAASLGTTWPAANNLKAVTGQGVTVAVVDSGVSGTVGGLNGAGKVVQGPDLSMEANSSLRGQDTFGHGTFLAGIIAAKDSVALTGSGQPQPNTDDQQLGVAPDAKVLAVKLASTDGSTDVSQVIAALDWVVQHKHDNGMNVRVVNLSYGTDSAQSYLTDPLAAAAENAWRNGIVVIVSGGNEGNAATGLTDPAIDPYVIAVGASSSGNSVQGWSSPTVASFSQHGNAVRSVDLVAPGTSLVSLRDNGSYIDINHPEGLVAGDTSGRLFRGSGTSQAAAVVSGSVALLLQAFPSLTPDEVKYALIHSADAMAGSPLDKGAGELDVVGAMGVAYTIVTHPTLRTTTYPQTFKAATGTGSLDAARGGYYLSDPDTGAVLTGEVDVQSQPWKGSTWQKASAAATAWNGGNWNGARWSGSAWSGGSWSSANWSGARWSGARWSDVAWSGARWSGARWSGARWSGVLWQ